jgi:hypothetical protein
MIRVVALGDDDQYAHRLRQALVRDGRAAAIHRDGARWMMLTNASKEEVAGVELSATSTEEGEAKHEQAR